MLVLPRLILTILLLVLPSLAAAQQDETGSRAGPLRRTGPIRSATRRPSRTRNLRFPPAAGANDQTFRLVVRPDLWGRQARLRLTNVFGTKPVTFDGVLSVCRSGGPAVAKATNRPVTFGGKDSVTVPPGASVWSDAVALAFVRNPAAPDLAGRKLVVSFHVAGESGPMTWHAKALQTSYVSTPGPVQGRRRRTKAHSLTHRLVVLSRRGRDDGARRRALRSSRSATSITDGTASTMNGDDRWPDVLSRRLHAIHGNRVAVVNAGIGGNQIAGPAEYGPAQAVSRRAVGAVAHRARRDRPFRRLGT